VPGDHEDRTLMRGAPVEVLPRVPLFADLSPEELQHIALLFKERDFGAGETIIQQGFGGSAATRLDCYALTSWDFRPLAGANGVIGSKLLQRMAMLLREARVLHQPGPLAAPLRPHWWAFSIALSR
jgi:CRP/FNR family transcriptional regulator, cyclic AMP receptor protein